MPVWRPFSKLDLRNQFGSEPHAVFHFLPCQRPLRPLFFWQVDERAGIVPLAEAGKLGAPLVQYPAGFLFTPGDLEKVETTLRWFYDYPKVVELRHKSWSENSAETNALLKENRASEVIIDEPKFSTSIRQEFQAVGDIFYFRAHGRNAKACWKHAESWERYDYLYSRAEIKK